MELTLKQMIEQLAADEGKTLVEAISSMQAAAALVGDDELLDELCDLKWVFLPA